MKNKSKFRQMALCAVFSALSVVLLLLGTFLDILDITVAAVCSLITVICFKETGIKYSLLMFMSTSLLSLIFTPASSAVIYYISFFGYFPCIVPYLAKLGKTLCTLLSFLIFNITLIADFLLFTKIFGIENEPWWMYVILIAVSDIFFFAYRYALAIFAFLYEKKLKKILRL